MGIDNPRLMADSAHVVEHYPFNEVASFPNLEGAGVLRNKTGLPRSRQIDRIEKINRQTTIFSRTVVGRNAE